MQETLTAIELLKNPTKNWKSGIELQAYGIPWEWLYSWEDFVGLEAVK